LSATELLCIESTFRQCIDYVDIVGRSSARICRALTFALARLSCFCQCDKLNWLFINFWVLILLMESKVM